MRTTREILHDKIQRMTGGPPRPGLYILSWSRPGDLAYVAGPFPPGQPLPAHHHGVDVIEVEA